MSNDRPLLNSDTDTLEFSIAAKWLMRRTELNSNDKLVYIRLRNCTYKMSEYWVSLDYLVHETGIPKATVKRCISRLVKYGLISKTRHGKKMFNSYKVHQHEWMTDENKYKKSESSNRAVTESESSFCTLVRAHNEPCIYKEQNKQQNNICNFSKKNSKAKLNEQIKDVFDFWQKAVKEPGWSLTTTRFNKIKSALTTGVKQVDPQTLEKFESALTVEQVKELISLHLQEKWWVENNRIDLTSILTQQRMTDYVEGRLKQNSRNKEQPKDIYNIYS